MNTSIEETRKVGVFWHWHERFNKNLRVIFPFSFIPPLRFNYQTSKQYFLIFAFASKVSHLYCLMHAMSLIMLQYESKIATLAFNRQLLTWMRFDLFLRRSIGLGGCWCRRIRVSRCGSIGLRWYWFTGVKRGRSIEFGRFRFTRLRWHSSIDVHWSR